MLLHRSSWTLTSYEELCCATLEAGYSFVTIAGITDCPYEKIAIFRHDIDRFPGNSLRMAMLEHSLGISATYYVRMTPHVYSRDLVARLYSLGHEVGYHYETLSKCNGDMPRALDLFSSELEQLRSDAPISTIAAHGSPLSKWDNRTLRDAVDMQALRLRADAYGVVDEHGFAYFTDTGRCWDATATNLRDRMGNDSENGDTVHTTSELINRIQSKRHDRICIQTHPERWSASSLQLLRSAMLDTAATSAKRLISELRHAGMRES